MAHHLAEAICELAAPGLQPCFIRVQAHEQEFPIQTLLLHVHPRPLAAGLEVAVYSGMAQNEEATVSHMGREGTIFAVHQTQAALEQFIADLLAAGPEEWEENGPNRLMLPTRYAAFEGGWHSVRLDLLAPAAVRATMQPPAFGHGPPVLRITTPFIFDAGSLGSADVLNAGSAYARQQVDLKRKIEQQKKKEAASAAGTGGATSAARKSGTPAAALEQPDSQQVFDEKWRALRDKAMADLHAALLAMLRQAVRYRGTLPFPVADAAAVPGGGAGDAVDGMAG